MFRVFYDHAKDSASEYYSWVSHLLETPGFWVGVTGGLRYFGDQNLLLLLEDTKQIIDERKKPLNMQMGVGSINLKQDNELSHTVDRLYGRFQEIVPDSLKRISSFIRSNQQDFVIIEK